MRWFRSTPPIRPLENADALQRPTHRDVSSSPAGLALRVLLSRRLSLTALALLGLAAPAYGAVTLNDVTNASVVEGLGETAITVYGGVAGPTSSCPDSTSLCNSCAGATSLIACNEQRIQPDVPLTITLTTDTQNLPTTAQAIITGSDGNNAINQVSTPPLVTTGNQVTFQVTWRNLCLAIDSSNSGNCLPSSGDSISKTLWIGVDADGNNLLNDSGDEKVQVSFTIARIPNEDPTTHLSPAGICSDTSTTIFGICHFAVFPGDEKFYMEDLRGLNGFPNSSSIPFKKLRVFYSDTSFSAITPDMQNKQDLTVEGSGTAISVTPKQVAGGLRNETTYFVKVAGVDAAGNVGFYTDNDTYCDYASTGIANCHEVTPGEVVGVLSKDMNCFIATAAYGSIMAPQVETFRRFRDQFLKPTTLGKRFVEFYYEHSPKYAKIIAESESLRAVSRVALWPLLAYAWLSLKVGAALALALCAGLILVPLLTLRSLRRGRNLRGAPRA